MKKAAFLLFLPLLVGCNNVEDIPFIDEQEPILLTAENLDLNDDGFTDTIRLTFDERIRDETVRGGDFSIDGINSIDFQFDTNGDKSHDEFIYLTITDGVHSIELLVVLNYTQGTVADMSGNLLPNTVTNTIPPTIP